jgi:hypothetical protein
MRARPSMRPSTIRPPCSRNWSTPIWRCPQISTSSKSRFRTGPPTRSSRLPPIPAGILATKRSASFCATWHDEKRSALLIIPSIPARIERNFLINPVHPDARTSRTRCPSRYGWDERLYGGFEEEALLPQKASPWLDMCLAYFQHPGVWGGSGRGVRQVPEHSPTICIIV